VLDIVSHAYALRDAYQVPCLQNQFSGVIVLQISTNCNSRLAAFPLFGNRIQVTRRLRHSTDSVYLTKFEEAVNEWAKEYYSSGYTPPMDRIRAIYRTPARTCVYVCFVESVLGVNKGLCGHRFPLPLFTRTHSISSHHIRSLRCPLTRMRL